MKLRNEFLPSRQLVVLSGVRLVLWGFTEEERKCTYNTLKVFLEGEVLRQRLIEVSDE